MPLTETTYPDAPSEAFHERLMTLDEVIFVERPVGIEISAEAVP
jgi:hypothetical protein